MLLSKLLDNNPSKKVYFYFVKCVQGCSSVRNSSSKVGSDCGANSCYRSNRRKTTAASANICCTKNQKETNNRSCLVRHVYYYSSQFCLRLTQISMQRFLCLFFSHKIVLFSAADQKIVFSVFRIEHKDCFSSPESLSRIC